MSPNKERGLEFVNKVHCGGPQYHLGRLSLHNFLQNKYKIEMNGDSRTKVMSRLLIALDYHSAKVERAAKTNFVRIIRGPSRTKQNTLNHPLIT